MPQQGDTVLLSQILGIEQGEKQRANKKLSELQKSLRLRHLMEGSSRSYEAVDAMDVEQMPSEYVLVQVRAEDVLGQVEETMVSLWDIVLTREAGNTEASGDIVVGETTIASAVPVTMLLFLEKQLADIRSILAELPVHDPSETWAWDASQRLYRSPDRRNARTKKVPFAFVLAASTEKHPAQVQKEYEDRVVGWWDKVLFTGALPADRVKLLQDRAAALSKAVTFAREKANASEVTRQSIGQQVFAYLLAP